MKRSKKLPVEVNEREFIDLLKATKKMRHKVAFLLAWQSGLRISEITNLEKKDFDIERKEIFIHEGKGSKDRVAILPIDWMEHLINYIPIGTTTRALQFAFERYAKRSGLTETKPTVHFHSLRHGFATHLTRKGVKLPLVQQLMGHSDMATTSIYLRLSPEEAKQEAYSKW